MSLLALTAEALLDRLAASDPTPGGGSAAAWAGATAAALVCMVAGMDKTRTGAPDERERLAALLAAASADGRRLRVLVDEDTLAYDAVMAAYRLPKATDEEKAARKPVIAAALARATAVPLETAERCAAVLAAAAGAAADGNPNALSDARTAGALAWAGLTGALENVRINTKEGDPARARAAVLVADAQVALRGLEPSAAAP
ncbi:MAG: cyclodeaminase/cyclohydrolase family protein [Vicinamibacteria bacterium]